ncbi:GDSL-type esterase/lipase family protein [Streptomyces sp. NPDC060366]|uniref:GDSL-type esterase/lipase family protein n=1 Tax=Streptomyces sp. NPDC060366 TaxID=3347105 RepID=UPI0036528592
MGPEGPQGEPGDPATNLVTSVNGQQGVVVLDAADVGADPAGTATAAVSPLDTRLDGVEDALPLKADKAGADFTGPVNVVDADLSVHGDGKGYRFRRGGGALDLEATGADLIVSNWSGPDYDGTQRSYDRYSADALNVQHAGKREFVSGLYGTTRHVIDPDANQIGFFEEPPVGQQTVTGSTTSSTLASVVAALASYGLAVDASAPDAKGVYVPAGWGEHWRAARAQAVAGTGLARIVTLGGSATQGFYASNPHTASWPGVVRAALQAEFGDGGGGFKSSSMSSTVLASGDATALAAWQSAGAIVGQTGTWSLSANRYGPGITGVYTEAAGATMTYVVRGATVRIFTISGGTRPSFTYAIDGASAVTVTVPAGSAAVQVTTVTGLTAGNHTVVLTCGTTTTGQYLTVAGVSGENASGVIVHNLARAGAGSGSYATLPESALNATWNGGVSYPADLCIYTAGPNDASSDVLPDVWVDNLAAWLKGVRDTGASVGATDIVIGLPHYGKHTGSTARYAEYAARLRSLADAHGAAVVNWWTIGRNSWEFWNGQGLWGTNAGTGAAGSDSVHLSDAGFEVMAAPVVDLLRS